MATSNGLEVLVFEYQQEQKIFFFPKLPTVSGAHPASYSVRNEVLCRGKELKRSGYSLNHSLPSTAEVKNGWSYNYFPHTPSWCKQRQLSLY
jgi:hypothetical protein